MKARLAILGPLVVAVALLVTLALSDRPLSRAGSAAGSARAAGDARSGAEDDAVLLPPDVTGDERAAVAGSTEDVPDAAGAEAPAAPPEAADDGRAHVVGRFLLPGGAPAAGAQLELHGWQANSERVQKYGAPEDWQDVVVMTDAEGRFDLAFDPPRAFQFTAEARLAGHAELSWRWSSLAPASTTDLGTHTFVPACTVVGRVVDRSGAPTGIPWTVYADSQVGASGPAADGTRVIGPADPTTGRFELDGIPPGPVALEAYSRSANWVDGPTVTATLGAATEAEIVYAGPDLSSSITVRTFCRPFHIFSNPRDGRIVARAADGTEFEAERIEGSSQSYVIEDLPEGTYTVEVTSAVHEPWSRPGVRPGETVDARLAGGARVALTVVDAGTGQPVERYGVRVRFEDSNWNPNVFTVVETSAEPPVGGLLESLIPWDTTLLVDAEGYAPQEVPLGELRAGVTTPAEARLGRGATLQVVVFDGSGAPARGVDVLLHPYHQGYDPQDPFSGPRDSAGRDRMRNDSRDETTDGAGAVTFSGLAPGEWGLRATRGALAVSEGPVAAREGGTLQVALRLPASGSLVGRLTGGPEGAFAGTLVRARPTGGDAAAARRLPGDGDEGARVDGADRFRLDDLVARPHRLELLLPPIKIPTSRSSSSFSRSAVIDLGEVEVRPGAPTEVTVDAAHAVPGTFVVRATHNGAPAAGLVVHLTRSEGRAHEGRVLGPGAVEAFAPFLPGTWKVHVRSLDARWHHAHPDPVELAPGGRAEVHVKVVTAKGRLVILDAATGAPAANREVYLANGSSFRTDGDGVLEIEATEGSLVLSGKDPIRGGGARVEVPWGPEGPNTTEVRLTF